MPPTPTIGKDGKERRAAGDKKAESGLICKVRYCNSLPDIPFDPKFLVHPFDSNRFIQYIPTSLERNYKHELLTEHDLGVSIDLVDPDTYKTDILAKIDPEDERLLEEETAPQADAKRSRHHNKNVSWLRKTEYISTEFNRWVPGSAEKAESRIGFNIKKHFKEENLYRDRASQIEAIEATFEACQKPVEKHYSKPGVYATEVLPLLPDFKLWRHPCAQVIFDANPAKGATNGPSSLSESTTESVEDRLQQSSAEAMSTQAMIRGMVDETGDQFVAYFLPTQETQTKRKTDFEEGRDFLEEETYEYDLTREYNWNVKNKTMKGYEENYFLVFRDGGVYYNELETRVRLSKRRKPGQPGGAPTTKTKLSVRHREFNEAEIKQQQARLAQLEPDVEEEEEEEEAEEEEEPAAEGGATPIPDENVEEKDPNDPNLMSSDDDISDTDEETETNKTPAAPPTAAPDQSTKKTASSSSDSLSSDSEEETTTTPAKKSPEVASQSPPAPTATSVSRAKDKVDIFGESSDEEESSDDEVVQAPAQADSDSDSSS